MVLKINKTTKTLNPIAIKLNIFLISSLSIVAQILFIREFFGIFYGNEITIGLIFACWLFFTGSGSILTSKIAESKPVSLKTLFLIEFLIFILVPATYIAILLADKIFNFLPGEIINLQSTLKITSILLGPICFLFGSCFCILCRIFPKNNSNPNEKIATVYIWEALGAATGGGMVTFLLFIQLLDIEILCTAFVLSLMSLILLIATIPFKKHIKFITISIILIIIFFNIFTLFSNSMGLFYKKLISYRFRDFQVLEIKHSLYSNIAITEKSNQLNLICDGSIANSDSDILSSEEKIHYALLQHPAPKNILIISGLNKSLLHELKKYRLDSVDFVELDKEIIKLTKKYFLKNINLDDLKTKINFINADGRNYIKSSVKKYDVIILNIPNPLNAHLNRYYTFEFFKETKRALKTNGIVSLGVTSSENYISDELAKFLSSIYRTSNAVFKNVVIIPGNTAYFLASQELELNITPDFVTDKIKQNGIKTYFVNADYIFGKLTKERIDYIKNRVTNIPYALNYDFAPICYYFDTVLWSSIFSSKQNIFKLLTKKTLLLLCGFFIIFCFFCILFVLKTAKDAFGKIIPLAVAITGLNEISFQIITLLCFQILYGYLYYKLSLIIAAFMLGLTLGSWYAMKKIEKITVVFNKFIMLHCFILSYSLALPLVLIIFIKTNNKTWSFVVSNIIFPLIPFLSGILGGLQFPMATKLYLSRGKTINKTAGILYGADLLGSCLGAFLISAFIIPFLGIISIGIILAIINLIIVFALIHLNTMSVLK